MARRGRCRCGFVLKFQLGERGYKTRCPECGAMVRLRTQGRKKVRLRAVKCTCGYGVLLPLESSSITCPSCGKTVTAAGMSPALPVEQRTRGSSGAARGSKASAKAIPLAPLSDSRLKASQQESATSAVTCAICGTIVPTHAKRCPACGADTVQQTAPPSPMRSSGPRTAPQLIRSSSRFKMILGWAGALAALLVVAAIILVLLLRR